MLRRQPQKGRANLPLPRQGWGGLVIPPRSSPPHLGTQSTGFKFSERRLAVLGRPAHSGPLAPIPGTPIGGFGDQNERASARLGQLRAATLRAAWANKYSFKPGSFRAHWRSHSPEYASAARAIHIGGGGRALPCEPPHATKVHSGSSLLPDSRPA
jgi:hypothetical protein